MSRPTRPCPANLSWCTSHPAEEFTDPGDDGWHEQTVAENVSVNDADRVEGNGLHVALDVNHWTGTAAEARELAAELVRAAEVAEKIGAGR